MAQRKSKVTTPGVAEGKKLFGIPTDDNLTAEDKVTAFVAGAMSGTDNPTWGSALFRSGQLRLTSATAHPHGQTVFAFTVEPSQCNRLGNLHGGCTATLFDMCTSVTLAAIAKPGFWAFAGVTRTLNVTYLRPMGEGDEILIESEVVHAGRRLCTLKGTMRRKRDGAIMATCEHGKVNIDPEVSTKI